MADNEEIPIDPVSNHALDNANTADARDRELNAQATDNKSWIFRNINPIMGIAILILSFMFFIYVLNFDFEKESAKKDVVIYLLGAVTTILTSVVGYYFGSSKDSNDKDHVIRSQMRRKPPY